MQKGEFTITGTYSILASSKYCRLFKINGTNTEYSLFKIPSTNSSILNANITNLTSLLGILTTTTWAISEECSKIKAGNAVYVLSASGTYDLLTNLADLT